MAPQKIHILELLPGLRATFDFANKLDSARGPVLLPKLVLEGLRALVAHKVSAVEGLHDEAIELLYQVQVCSAVRTRVVFLSPKI